MISQSVEMMGSADRPGLQSRFGASVGYIMEGAPNETVYIICFSPGLSFVRTLGLWQLNYESRQQMNQSKKQEIISLMLRKDPSCRQCGWVHESRLGDAEHQYVSYTFVVDFGIECADAPLGAGEANSLAGHG